MFLCILSITLWANLIFTPSGTGPAISVERQILADSGHSLDYTSFSLNDKSTVLVLVRMHKRKTVIEVTDQSRSTEFQIPQGSGNFSRLRCFHIDQNIYVYMKSLYCLNPDSNSYNKTELLRTDYRYINVLKENRDTLMLASSGEFVDVYSLPAFKPIHQIRRAEYLQFDVPFICRNHLYFRSKANELCIYDLQSETIVHRFNTGTQTASFLGIPIGNFEDKISWYQLDRNRLYFTTYSGALYKADPGSGEIIDQADRFRGFENNAGLITWFTLHDFNSDGHPDLVGPSVDQNVYCINGNDFSLLWIHDAEYEIQMPLSLYDITGDDIPEVYGVTDNMNLWILDGLTGKALFKHRITAYPYQTSVGILDIDYDGKPEFVLNRDQGTLDIWQFDSLSVEKGKVLWLPLF